jgi:hypothetical protein
LAGYRPDHRAGVELAAIDAHRAAEAAANLERRFDDGVGPEARPDRFEIGDFAGWATAEHSVSSSFGQGVRTVLDSTRTNERTVLAACVLLAKLPRRGTFQNVDYPTRGTSALRRPRSIRHTVERLTPAIRAISSCV